MTIQDDWITYIEDPKSFKKHHFEYLLTDTEEPADLSVLFANIVNGSKLIERIERVRENTDFTGLYYVPAPRYFKNESQLVEFAHRYSTSLTQRLRAIGEDEGAQKIETNKIVLVSNKEFVELKRANAQNLLNAPSYIESDFIDYTSGVPSWFFGLEEAVLNMTKFPPVTRYILSAIVNYPVDDEAYFELWIGGGDIEFFDNQTVISRTVV